MTVLIGLGLWIAFCVGFAAGGAYSAGMMARKMQLSDERMRVLRSIDEAWY